MRRRGKHSELFKHLRRRSPVVSSALKTGADYCYETMVFIYQTPSFHSPEAHILSYFVLHSLLRDQSSLPVYGFNKEALPFHALLRENVFRLYVQGLFTSFLTQTWMTIITLWNLLHDIPGFRDSTTRVTLIESVMRAYISQRSGGKCTTSQTHKMTLHSLLCRTTYNHDTSEINLPLLA